jgi:hypothetical protein
VIRGFVLVAAIALASAPGAGAELITNGSFDQNIDGWSDPIADPNTTIQWYAWDVHSSPTSGSLFVMTNMADAYSDGPWQCVATTPGPHTASAAAEVNTSTLKIDPRVEMRLDFFATPDCSGGALPGGDGAVALVSISWETLTTAPLVAPADTQSARLRFLVGGTYDGKADSAFFDDVSLVPEPGDSALCLSMLVALGALVRRRNPARDRAVTDPARQAGRATGGSRVDS